MAAASIVTFISCGEQNMVRVMKRWMFAAVTACLVSACGDDGSGADGGVLMDANLMDADSMADAGGNRDAEVDRDADSMTDARMLGCMADGECGMGEACVRGVCIANCGADLSGLSGILEAAGLTPRSHVCGSFAALESGATTADHQVFALTVSEPDPNSLELRRWTLGAEPPPASAFRYDTGGELGMSCFLNDYVALTPSGSRAAVGYTNIAGDGRVVYGELDSALGGLPQSLPIAGSYDMQWLDGERLAVSGTGWGDSGRHGVYVVDLRRGSPSETMVISGGCNSGSVAITADFALIGAYCGFGSTWPDGEPDGGRTFALPRAAFDRALAARVPIALFEGPALSRGRVFEVEMEGVGSNFDVLESGRVVAYTYDAMFGWNASVFTASFDEATGLEMTPTPLILRSDDHSFGSLTEVPGGLLVRMESGILWVEE